MQTAKNARYKSPQSKRKVNTKDEAIIAHENKFTKRGYDIKKRKIVTRYVIVTIFLH